MEYKHRKKGVQEIQIKTLSLGAEKMKNEIVEMSPNFSSASESFIYVHI